VVCVTIVVTGRDEEELTRSREAVRKQLAFYGTTPAYQVVFDLHGYVDGIADLLTATLSSRDGSCGPGGFAHIV
jgi:hypothetical protein